jgi:hypothetical protein
VESLVLCAAAFTICLAMTNRSLLAGLGTVITVGYFYGIVRANVPQTGAHFFFDCAAGGLYLGLWLKGFTKVQKLRTNRLRVWTTVLFAWPIVLFFIPIQTPMVQLVGLRGAVWFLPFLLVGGCLSGAEVYGLAIWLAMLNLVALGFGGAEYFWGVTMFFPRNEVTTLIYNSNDVAQYTALRIPSLFVNSATYCTAMNLSLPFLVSAWFLSNHRSTLTRWILLAAIAAACIGVFLGASRSQAIVLLLFAGFLAALSKLKLSNLIGLAILGLGIGYVVAQNPRLQRFTSLQDTDYVQNRLAGSVNSTFLDAAMEYPMGNGLGGGGTSLPYFLKAEADIPMSIENEYARIMLEEGLPGLCLWLGFLLWAVARKPSWPGDEWEFGRRFAWFTCCLYALIAVTGTGAFTSVPGSAILLILMGWMSSHSILPGEKAQQKLGSASHDQRVQPMLWPSTANG